MNPDDFDRLPRKGGSTVINLMRDPDGDESSLFVSLVDRGANGRRIAVAKADDESGDGAVSFEAPTFTADLNNGGARSWVDSMIERVMSIARKSGDFDENATEAIFWERFYRATSVLDMTIREIGRDQEGGDRERVDRALRQFARHVSEMYAAVNEVQRGQIGKILADGVALPVIKSEDPATIGAADAGDQPEHTNEEEINMDLDKIADNAAKAAVRAAKAANPNASPADLVKVATEASTEVFKAAVMGPKQPGIPTNALSAQIAQSGAVSGSMRDPGALAASTIQSIANAVKKSLADDLATQIDESVSRALKGTDDEPGLAAVVEAHGKAMKAVTDTVQKIAGTPRKPASADNEEPAKIQKSEDGDDVWKGSALSGF